MTRKLIDLDNVLYDIFSPWLKLYHQDHPDDILEESMFQRWDITQFAKGDIYSYLKISEVYSAGGILDIHSINVTKKWIKEKHEIGIVTNCVNTVGFLPKVEWIRKNFSHIKNIHILTGHTKHWIRGDFLIDDGVHNLEHFDGIGILVDRPWNRHTSKFIRVHNWNEIEKIVDEIDTLLEWGVSYKGIKERYAKD